ncbi:MAG: PspC domain-containing protein [Chloroflexota bacterium]
MNRRLYRSRSEQVMSGVAGGVAEYLDVNPSVVRIVWVLLAIVTGGIFLALYVVMWIVVPVAPYGPATEGAEGAGGEPGATAAAAPSWESQAAHRARRRSDGGSWAFGLILIGLGGYFLAREYLPGFDLDRLWPLGLVVLGVLLVIVAFRRRGA